MQKYIKSIYISDTDKKRKIALELESLGFIVKYGSNRIDVYAFEYTIGYTIMSYFGVLMFASLMLVAGLLFILI